MRERERERESKNQGVLVPLDTSWFDEEPERYLAQDDFIEFQKIAGVDFRGLLSEDKNVVGTTQKNLVDQSIILNEIQKSHFGYEFPFIIYTHSLNFFENVKNHNLDMDRIILGRDMGDSLRRRHISLSHAIIPSVIRELNNSFGRPVVAKNLGSGVGLDVINAASKQNGMVKEVLNYDTNQDAVSLGQLITTHLEDKGELDSGKVKFILQSLMKSKERVDLIIKIGVICGLQDNVALSLIKQDFNQLSEGGKLIISSSNECMKAEDPLGSFLIQHMGSRKDPFEGWGLNCRSKLAIITLLEDAGFKNIEIYSDTRYPGKEDLPDEIILGVDTLPAEAVGYNHPGIPLNLPPKHILDQETAYNWIAVAAK